MDIAILERLGIRGKKTELRLKSACTVQNLDTVTANVIVRPYDGKGQMIFLPRVTAVKEAKFKETPLPTRAELGCKEIIDLKLDEIQPEVPVVSMIIGTRAADCFVPESVRKTTTGMMVIKGPLGWSWLGGERSQNVPQTSTMTCTEDLEFRLKTMFEIERTGPVCGRDLGWSRDDHKAVGIMESTIKIIEDEDGPHYQMAIPWKAFPPKLEDNKYVAKKCMDSLKNRFRKDENYFQMYAKQMAEYETKGYSARVTTTTPDETEGRHYVTHHGVISEKKPGKVRVVFNCAKSFNDKSVNSCIYSGPDLTRNLREVLIRWRTHEIVVTGDVQEMYHRVRTDPRDYTFLRYLWWPENDRTKELVEYFMKVHLFGCISSSAAANFALQRTAKDNEKDHSQEVVQAVTNDFYVDDFAKSFKSTEEAANITLELTNLLRKGGFSLKKITSNHPEVVEKIPEELQSLTNEDVKVLGLQWNSKKDSIVLELQPAARSLNKRGLLGICMSLFDPLGLISIITFQLREVLQDLCRRKIGWDDDIPNDTLCKVTKLLISLKSLDGMEVPRCIKPKFRKTKSIQVHHFGDASLNGYATCSYLRCETQENAIYVTLISGKSRIAPLKGLTIVRLEFLAARTMAREEYTIKKSLPITVPSEQTFFWTDSEIVLKCISNDSRRFQLYAANILAEIHEISTPVQWRHVTSGSNVADDATRLIDLSKLRADSRWFKGPEFLQRPQIEWDKKQDFKTITAEDEPFVLKKETGRCATSTSAREENWFTDKFIEYFSSLPKLVNATAWLTRFVKLLSVKPEERRQLAESFSADVNIHEMRKAFNRLIQICQNDEYHEECKQIMNSGKIRKSSSIYRLGIDFKDGLLCLRGRLGLSDLQSSTKHPAILPQKHHLTRLVISDIHNTHGHQGLHYVIAESRMRFWIIHANAAVKNVLANCIPCKRYNAKPCEQQMADLPADRVTEPPGPFERTGVDLFGPFYVRIGRSTVKRYAALFTDLVYRGVHIEILHSLSTDSFLLSLQRFCDRRGTVKLIRSDRGSNFTASNREIREATIALKNTKISRALQNRNIEWIFNPAKASHWGGVWERLIRSARSILNHLIGKKTLNDETLLSVMTTTEAILNNRPLQATSPDVNDLSALTPNHFLQLKAGQGIPYGIFQFDRKTDSQMLRSWRFVEKLKTSFWRRFTREYLLTLNIRSKWLKIRDNLRVGDLVLIVDENLHRSDWKLGRVLDVSRGRDGLVRSVGLRTATASRITRPITKVCFLEGSEER